MKREFTSILIDPWRENLIRFVIMLFLTICLPVFLRAQTATNTYPGGVRNWTALTWVTGGGGVPPVTNNATYTQTINVGTIGNGDNLTVNISFTLNGTLNLDANGSNPTFTIPAGVTVVINGNLTNNDNNVRFVVNGTLIVTGTLSAGNNAVLGGNGTISGGILALSGNGGSAPTCSGSCPVINFGDCSTNTNAAFCTANNTTSTSYVWNGSTSSDWQISSNWTPTRTSPATTDFLTFSGSGANKSITNVPNQTVGKILVTGSSTYSFAPSASGNTLTLSIATGETLQIDNGSTLTLGTSNALNMTLPTNGTAEIGGQINLFNGNLSVGNANLTLHTNSTPLARTGGQVSTNSNTTINFGSSTYTSGSTIVLPNSIFVADPTPVSSLTVNRTNGATLGDQTISVTSTATFTLGVLNTNGAGRLEFSASATNPAETATSYINGFAQMALRSVGTAAYDFLGLSLASGSDIGSVTLVRRTGTSGINTFNSNQSIASTWIVTNTVNNGRNVVFRWVSPLDNVTNSANQFQVYRFSSGPGWTGVGSLAALTATTPRRQTTSVAASTLNDTFTVTDQTQILPVTLVSFTGRQTVESSVELKWSTASEQNFSHFSVERSIDGRGFIEVGRVTSSGDKQSGNDYFLVDEKPIVGANYYRLRAVDLDGTFEYSSVLSVEFTQQKKLAIFPNPTNGRELNVNLNFTPKDEVTAIFFNQMGEPVSVHPIKFVSTRIYFDKPLPSGFYFVKFLDSGFNQVTRFIVAER